MARGQRRGGRLDDRRVAEQRVAVAGGERRGDQAAGARAQHLGSIQGIVAALVGRQLARGVDLRTRDVGVDVDAAGHHDHPAGVDPARARDRRRRPPCRPAGTRRGPRRRRRWRGRGRAPPLIRIAVTARPPRAAALSSTAAVGASPGCGACSASGTPSSRWAVPAARTPAAAVRIATSGSTPSDPGRLPSAISVTPGGSSRAGALDAQRHVDALGGRERLRGGDQLRMAAGEVDASGYPVCQASTSSAPVVPAAPGSASVTTWRSWHSARTSSWSASARRWPPAPAVRPAPYTNVTCGTASSRSSSPSSSGASSLRPQRQLALQGVQAGQRLEVAVGRPAEPQVRAPRRGGVAVVDDDQRPLPRSDAAAEAEPVEQPRMGALGILAPDDDELRAVADLAQGGGRGAAQGDGRSARPRIRDCAGGDERPEPVGQRDRGPRVLHGGSPRSRAAADGAPRAAARRRGRAQRRRRPARRRPSPPVRSAPPPRTTPHPASTAAGNGRRRR